MGGVRRRFEGGGVSWGWGYGLDNVGGCCTEYYFLAYCRFFPVFRYFSDYDEKNP